MKWPFPTRAVVHFAIAMLATLVVAVLATWVVEGHADHIDRTVALAVHDRLGDRDLVLAQK